MADIQYNIEKALGMLSENKSGWKREVNLISWNGAEPKIDIRDWAPDHSKMGKGISLSSTEAQVLMQILTPFFANNVISNNNSSSNETTGSKSSDPQPSSSVEKKKKEETESQNSVLNKTNDEFSDSILEKKLERIERGLPYLDDVYTWNAFHLSPDIKTHFKGDNNLFYKFCKDAAKAVTRISYDLTYLEIRETTERVFRELLQKYDFPEDEIQYLVHDMLVRFFAGRINVFNAVADNENFQGEIPELSDDDMDTTDMAFVFATLPEQPEVKDYLSEIDVTYDYDQLHMVTWFSVQITLGDGKYSRQVPNHSAKMTYNRLLNPYSLLWIAAALGEDKNKVIAAAKEAEHKPSFAAKCGVVRKLIPFSRIVDLADQRLAEYDREHPEAVMEEE